ncbi:hypothetical protein ACFSZT_16150 [Prauserella oleivorans]|uniref:hypothetical protein n=1 Tax=Prauserella oleivorans TaxID=1478153 RepID=UPI003641316D
MELNLMICGNAESQRQHDREEHEWLPLDSARNSFAWLVTGPRPLSVSGRRFRGLPNRPVPLDELRDRLLNRRCPRETRDAVWAHMVRRSRRDGPTWTVACVGMALPALARTARWLAARYRGERADAHAVVLSGFLEALATVDIADSGVLNRLIWRARQVGQAALEESLDAPMPAGLGFGPIVPQAPWGHPDLVLARAVGDEVLTPVEADVISATRVGEVSLTEWAATHGTTYWAAYKMRQRAEARLVDYLRDDAVASTHDDPVADAALAATAPTRSPAPADAHADQSRAVSGRRRNGRPAST